ncbi:MAG: glycosyltransferase family 39 protein [Chloroflexi bacterium]|nr:glycosyltransferase family 39 protein [Chloroflexota bacterium]
MRVALTSDNSGTAFGRLTTRLGSRQLQLLAGGLVIALAVRLFLLQFVQRVDWDGIFYLFYAKHILAGDWLRPSPQWAPYPLGYPVLIASLSSVLGDLTQAGAAVSLIAGILLTVPTYAVSRLLFGPRTAWIAVWLVALDALLVRYSIAVLSESLFTLLFMLMVWLWVSGLLERDLAHYLALSLLVGLALTFVRPIGLAVTVGSVLIIALRKSGRWKLALASCLVAASVLVVYAVYAGAVADHLQQLTGSPQPNYALQEMSRGLAQYFEVGSSQSPIVAYQTQTSLAQFLSANGSLIARRYASVLLGYLAVGVNWQDAGKLISVFPFYLLPFAGIGLWLGTENQLSRALLLGTAPYLLLVPLFVQDARYYVPLLPVFLVFAAAGLDAIVRRNWRIGSALVAGVLSLAALLAFQGNAHTWPVPVDPYKEAGLWLRAHETPEVVLSPHPAPAFYADAEPLLMSGSSMNDLSKEIAAVGNRRSAIVVVAGSAQDAALAQMREGTAEPRVTLVYHSPLPNAFQVDAYRVSPQ